MMIGDVALQRVEEQRIPNKISYFTQDAELLNRHRHWLAPHFLDHNDAFDLCFQSWVFESGGRVVVVDPCNGNGRPHCWPWFDNLDIPYIERFEATGYRPGDVDFVVCTHLHHDHCGWNTELREGRWVPTFPNARYLLRREEYNRWGSDRHRHARAEFNDGVFERSVQPVVDAGLAEIVTGSHRFAPGLTLDLAPGHTAGHQMLHLVSADRHALFTGDCFHHPIQLVDTMNPFGDPENLSQLSATRRWLVERAAELDALLIAAHLPFPYALRVHRAEGGFEFSAAV